MPKWILFLGVLMLSAQAKKIEKATFGAGCFWGVEHILEQQLANDGEIQTGAIIDVVSGYSGGDSVKPSYAEVSTGISGHIEVVQVTYDSSKLSYEKLLEFYFRLHDPTQVNGQGPDIGPQYQSVIFYHDKNQENVAKKLMEKITVGKFFDKPLATKLKEFKAFYPAEAYHQNYYVVTKKAPYCHALRKSFKL